MKACGQIQRKCFLLTGSILSRYRLAIARDDAEAFTPSEAGSVLDELKHVPDPVIAMDAAFCFGEI